MTQTFRPYSEIPMILEQAVKKNQHIAASLKEYIIQFSGDFAGLKEKLTKLTLLPLVSSEKKQDKPQEEEFHSELFKAFPEIAVKHLLQIKSYEKAANELKAFASKRIGASANEYTARNRSLLQKFQDELANFEHVKASNEQASLAYREAGFALQKADKENSKNIAKFQKEFVDAKNKAIAANEKAMSDAETCTLNMEALLTQFEELEHWRADDLKSILLDFSSTLISIANNFVTGSSEMNDEVSKIPIELDSHVIARFDQFRPAETDDYFQVWQVHPLVTRFLNKEYLYPQEVANGAQLFVVKENYKGPAGHLNGYEGEIVCGIEQRGDCVYCKNINESVGLLPKKILDFPK